MQGDEPAATPLALPRLQALVGQRHMCSVLTSPARRCQVDGATVEHRLRPWDLGGWTGRRLSELDLESWRDDPSYDAHGGESLERLAERVRSLAEDLHRGDGPVVAVTHAAIVKLFVVQALRAPITAVWDVDVAPASVTELHRSPTGWRVVSVNSRPLGSAGRSDPGTSATASPARWAAGSRPATARTPRSAPGSGRR